MIENDRQLEVSKKWLERFRAGLELIDALQMEVVNPLPLAVQRTAFQSQIEELEYEIGLYQLEAGNGVTDARTTG